MRFLLRPNTQYPEAVAFSKQLQQHLTDAGHEWCAVPESKPDMAIIIGGDGTVLQAVRELYHYHIPFWSVNYGHLGYLAECEPADAIAALDRLLKGDYRLEKRVMLEGSLQQNGQTQPFFGLNEAVLHRGTMPRTLHIRLAIDGTDITSFAGDGVLISTPTGSTAYNLSAGGPILLPEAKELVVTPICAHSAVCAPIVVGEGRTIQVSASFYPQEDTPDKCGLILDGAAILPLQQESVLTCRISSESVTLVKTGQVSFYQRLQQKLSTK